MCIELIEISKSLLTPVIAGVTTYIALQQWKTNKYKFVLDRFDRRFQIYEEVKKILNILIKDENVKKEDILKFRSSVSTSGFLFKPEIPTYIDEIYKHGLNMRRCKKNILPNTKENIDNNNKFNDEINNELMWFARQFDVVEIKFKKYLDISM